MAYSILAVGGHRIVLDDVVGPAVPNLNSVFLSNNGEHTACTVFADQTQHVLFDYVGGPVFDSIDEYSIRFSPDGSRLAYVGKMGRRSAVVADGIAGPVFDTIPQSFPKFSPDGRHVVYAARNAETWRVVEDGVPGPGLQELDESSVEFSPDSRMLTYVGTAGGKYRVYVNGVPGPKFDEIERDSSFVGPFCKHVAYAAMVGVNAGEENFDKYPGRSWVVTDGVTGPEFDEIGKGTLVFSSDGDRVAYVGGKRETYDHRATQRVVVDGAMGPEFASIDAGPVECRDGRLEYIATEGYDADAKLVRVTLAGFGPDKR
jgi:hypothetical protein